MQGIITGIGDKDNLINVIQPEYDAVINDFIIGKNTILEGLVLNGNNLSAGTCILCGYRGIIEENKTLDTTAYVYGEFTLNFGNGEDSFNIVTSSTAKTTNVNPTEITSAGTYYLLLYVTGASQIDREHQYPKNSQYSVETENVLDFAVISETATTPTDSNELDEVITDLHISQPNRVANTEYVHAQIEREVDYASVTLNVESNAGVLGTITLQRKAGYVIATATGNSQNNSSLNLSNIIVNIPQDFQPTEHNSHIVIVARTTGINAQDNAQYSASIITCIVEGTTITYKSSYSIYSSTNNSNVTPYLNTTVISGWKSE